jgi:poly(3-hydroxybutyrate) depolymerase
MRRVALLFVVISAAVRADATDNAAPCVGCTLDIPANATDPVPLVVVLHGDTDNARERASMWRAAVLGRAWALLSLDCPAALGCPDGSWYQWQSGSGPTWVRDQVREVIDRSRIDTSRVYLVGWSGGATFIGKHVLEWTPMFAAAVIHGGGVAPRSDECPAAPLPTYFLVGDKNPGHGGAKRLRAYLEACDQDIEWDLLAGANHAKEDAALTPAKADEILRWLANHRRPELGS